MWAGALLAASLWPATPAAASGSGIDYTSFTVRTIRPRPGQAVQPVGTWSRDGTRIRFEVGGQLYDTSAVDGSGTRCITCGFSHPPLRIVGQNQSPFAESPDGRWLLAHGLGSVTSAPNLGNLGQVVDTDIFALALGPDGVATAIYPLTSGGPDEANLRPSFTPDGSQVIWWRNQGLGGPEEAKRWRIMVASFLDADPPGLSGARALVDRGGALVEDGGITADGRTYTFTATVGGDPELFALDLVTGAERRLTDHLGWDEFPKPAPNGEVIYFMSDQAHANLVCDPVWAASRQADLPSDADFLTVIPGTVVCGAGEVRPRPAGTQVDVRSNFDGYLLDARGRVIRLTPDGRAGIGSWSPDGLELSIQGAAFGRAGDEIAILTFRRT